MHTTRRICMITATCAAALVATGVSAADWPAGPIKVIVPFGAGGDTDYNARTLAKYLEPKLGVALPVVNVTGAGGSIGAREALGSPPDGQTVLFFHTAMLVNSASGIADFTWKDFELGCIAAREPGSVIVTQPDQPWNSVAELIEASKADPMSIDLTTNTGATTYLVGSLINQAGGELNFVDVGGSANRLTAVLGGNVDISQNPLGQVKPYIDNGELKALGSTAAERPAGLPDVPTMSEQGVDVVFQYEYFYLFPKGTPGDTVNGFCDAVEQVVTGDPAYAAEIKETYWQDPFFARGDEAVDRMNASEAQVGAVQF